MTRLISIVVPVYNVEGYLRKCLDSVLAQTYQSLEIILVDDGSTDTSATICDEYAKLDNKIVVIHKDNGGLSSARNAGIVAATGEFIGFVDSDDYIAPLMYEKLYTALIRTNADLAICNYVHIDEDGALVESFGQSPIVDEVLTKTAAMAKLSSSGGVHYVTAFNKLYKNELVNSIRFPEGKLHEDEFTVHHFFDACERIVTIPDVCYFYVKRDDSITTQPYTTKRFEDSLEASWERYQFFKDNGYKSALRSVYSVLLETTKNGFFEENKRVVSPIMRKVTTRLILHGDLRAAKLFLYAHKPFFLKLLLLTFFVRYHLASAFSKTPRYVIMATPEHGNLGDQAIVYAERRLLGKLGYKSHILEIGNNSYLRFADYVQKKIRDDDVIIIDGGGNLGTLWANEDDKICDIITRFKSNKIIVFPQTCYYGQSDSAKARLQKNAKAYSAAKDLTICLRDKASFDFAKSNFMGVNLIFCPDIVLSIDDIQKPETRSGVLLCFRRDKEKALSDDTEESIKVYLEQNSIAYSETTTVIEKNIRSFNRNKELKKKWNEFANSGLVITDRLHAMIFAAITGTPCIALDNKSKKVCGSYEWITELPYIHFVNSQEDVINLILGTYSTKSYEFDFEYPPTIAVKIKETPMQA